MISQAKAVGWLPDKPALGSKREGFSAYAQGVNDSGL